MLNSKTRVPHYEYVSMGCMQMPAFLSTFKGRLTQVSATVYERTFPAPYLGAVPANTAMFLHWSLTDTGRNLEDTVSICT